MMSRSAKPKSYTRYDDSRRDLRIFVPSLVIGLCLGAGGMYLWHTLPLTQKIDALTSAASTQKATADQCNHDRVLAAQDTDTARRALASCRSDLNAAQRAAATAQSDLAQSGVAAPSSAQTQIQAPAPSSIRLPVIPKPPPGRSTELPVPPSVPVQDDNLLPQIPTPPQITEQPAAQVFARWPSQWPPKPTLRPTRLPSMGTPPAPIETDPAPPDTLPSPTQLPAPAQALTASDSARINVGQEATLGSTMRIRLVAISQRRNGAFCVLAGDGFDSARIASGSNQRLPRGGHPVTLSVRVEDSDTCQVSVRPN